MTPPPDPARTIPLDLSPTHPGGSPHLPGRAAVTCRYKCGDACSHEPPNVSRNTYFEDVVNAVYSRRGALRASAVFGLAAGGAAALGAPAGAERRERHPARSGVPTRPAGEPPGLEFTAVRPNTEDAVVVPEGYEQSVVIRWGDPVLPAAPDFDFTNQSAEAQAAQFGFNNDFAALMPMPGRDRYLLVTSHEYTSEEFMFRGYDPDDPTEEQVRIAWAAHGLSVVEVHDRPGSGPVPRMGPRNRRITLHTPFRVTGPAAGSELLATSADPAGTTVLGTMNNCSGGVTPWGTILSGEENFHFYFANADQVTDPVAGQRLARYGVEGGASERKWERFDSRWDLAEEPNEPNRFGWVVEVDPYDPNSRPVKHTALGRMKHECANVRVAHDGRVVAYTGDDERFEYLYKFVSSGTIRHGSSRFARRHNMSLLDDGTLYVAKFTGDSPEEEIDGSGALPSDGQFDGRGEWIPLARGDRSYVPGMSAEEVYVFTRIAADKVGATKMDRPEDIQPSPVSGRVYCALTKNRERGTEGHPGADEPNPRGSNKFGQVLEFEERANDPVATGFSWRLLLVCGDPEAPDTYFAGFPKEHVSPIACPDNVAFDKHGNLWISTDSSAALGFNDGLYAVPVDGSHRGHLKLFLTVPRGAETCGPIVDERLTMVCVQHPGEVDGASADNPASHWPDGPGTQPRPSVVAVRPAHR